LSDLTFAPPFFGAYPPDHACPADAELPFGVQHVNLPSGFHRDVVVPSLKQWIEFGEIPDQGLTELAIKHEWAEFKAAELTADERRRYIELMVLVSARICRPQLSMEFVRGYDAPAPDGKPVDPALTKTDLEILWAVATGLIQLGEMREQRTELQAVMRNFRHQQGGTELPTNGANPREGSRRTAGAGG
jgi:hypothetical protein